MLASSLAAKQGTPGSSHKQRHRDRQKEHTAPKHASSKEGSREAHRSRSHDSHSQRHSTQHSNGTSQSGANGTSASFSGAGCSRDCKAVAYERVRALIKPRHSGGQLSREQYAELSRSASHLLRGMVQEGRLTLEVLQQGGGGALVWEAVQRAEAQQG
jgi:hypothetical protein